MASLEENYRFWNDDYNWTRYRGDQWSARWGGPEAQWRWCIYPRIRQYLPAETILEIGPGQGRWTRFLREHCQRLIVIDISERCLEVCRERLGNEGITYLVGDGRSLGSVEDNSVDFVFSFESLIHTEVEDMAAYFREFQRAGKDQAKGFVHHSNLGSYRSYYEASERLPKPVTRFLRERGFLDNDEWRARSVTASNMEKAAREAGLSMLSQELIPWGGRRLIDCFSSFQANPATQPNRVLENRLFLQRAAEIKRLSELYGSRISWLAGTL